MSIRKYLINIYTLNAELNPGSPGKFAFDLVYGKQTPFLNLAKSLNVTHSDGKQMLINQAILAFEIFMESQNISINQETLRHSMQNIL